MTTRKHAFYGMLALVSLLGLGMTQSARANFIATINQVGTDVVATGSGTLDLAALIPFGGGTGSAAIVPNTGQLVLGVGGPVFVYSGVSGPTSFGSGGPTFPDSSSGDLVGIAGSGLGFLVFPQGYSSGNPLSDTSTFNNATFASLGITPGTYTWTWGTGQHADSFTLQIGPASVPDAGSTLPLLSFALLGLVALRRKLRC
jgi:VPDSG-CTERM motif